MGWGETDWHGVRAWKLEDAALQVIIVPELGAKVASIYDKSAKREWLLGLLRPIRPVPYAANYLEYDMSGWDEMFPTIIACPHPAPGKFHNAALPDHGEVWAMAWTVEPSGSDELRLSVEGRALPYRLTRTAALGAEGQLKLHYQVANLSDEAIPYLWAAHPLFTVDASTRIVLPPEVQEVYNVFDMPAWGKPGTHYAWPRATLQDGKVWALDRVGSVAKKDNHKFYLPPEVSVSWAGLEHGDSGAQIRLEWTKEQVPYLGIWVDEGAYLKAPTAALEPSTAFYDGLDTAWTMQRYNALPSRGKHEWNVIVDIRTSMS